MATISNKQTCFCCGKTKAKQTNFYISHSQLYSFNDGRLPFCKECVLLKYEELVNLYADEKRGLYHLCSLLDVYYNNELCDSAYIQSSTSGNGNLAKIYFQKINSLYQYKGKTSIDSEKFKDEKIIEEIKEDVDIEFLSDYTPVKIDSEIIRRWGVGLTNDEYVFLETNYQEFIDSYSHETPSERLIFRQLSKVLLEGETCRKTGDRTGFEKMNKLVSQMLSDANIKPSQKKTFGETEGEVYGTFIKNIEMNEPIPNPLKQFTDVDAIERLIMKYFVKPFARVLDLNNFGYEEGVEDDNGN